jgi:molybdate transport system substrate-binding protein
MPMQQPFRTVPTLKLVAVSCLALAWLLGTRARGADVPARANATPAAATVTVAAAADLKFAMDDMVAQFTKAHPTITANVTYGSSGNFFSQLSNSAPFDMFFSADADFPRQLARQGLAIEGSEFLYAVGRIVIWVPRASSLDVQRLGMAALRDAAVQHVAIANPQHAPYGRAAVAAMKSLGVYEDVKQKLVFGENVAQTAQFVQSGAAEVGVIAFSLATAPAMQQDGKYWEVPLDVYPRVEQGGVIMKWAHDLTAARAFRDFVLSPPGRVTLKRYGFFFPGE